MIYKILINKNEIQIDEEEKNFFVGNQDKKFIELKSGELVNVAFVQGIIIDHEASRQEGRMKKPQQILESDKKNPPIRELLEKYRPIANER